MNLKLPIKVPISSPDCYIAPWPIELVSSMPAPNYDSTHQRLFTRVAHVLVRDCKKGDILDCSGTFQISNRLGELVEFSACMIITPEENGVGGIQDPFNLSSNAEPPNGKFVSRFPGYNVTPNASVNFPNGGMHHAPFNIHTRYIVPEGISGDQYIAIIAYAAGLTFDSSKTVSVDKWCGDLSVLRYK